MSRSQARVSISEVDRADARRTVRYETQTACPYYINPDPRDTYWCRKQFRSVELFDLHVVIILFFLVREILVVVFHHLHVKIVVGHDDQTILDDVGGDLSHLTIVDASLQDELGQRVQQFLLDDSS